MKRSPIDRMEKALEIIEKESFIILANRSENSAMGAWINWNVSNLQVCLLMMRAGVYNIPKLKEKLGLTEMQDKPVTTYPASHKEENDKK